MKKTEARISDIERILLILLAHINIIRQYSKKRRKNET